MCIYLGDSQNAKTFLWVVFVSSFYHLELCGWPTLLEIAVHFKSVRLAADPGCKINWSFPSMNKDRQTRCSAFVQSEHVASRVQSCAKVSSNDVEIRTHVTVKGDLSGDESFGIRGEKPPSKTFQLCWNRMRAGQWLPIQPRRKNHLICSKLYQI